MAKRKRRNRGLGQVLTHHQAVATHHLERFKAHATAAKSMAKQGMCSIALQRGVQALVAAGKAIAHNESQIPEIDEQQALSVSRSVMDEVRALETLLQTCLRNSLRNRG